MTRPIDLRPKEDAVLGTRFADLEIGKKLNPIRFTLTRDFMKEYAAAVQADPDGYDVDGRKAALPLTLAPYMAAVLTNTYRPQDGGIVTRQKWSFHRPLWMDEDLDIVATGYLKDKYERRGRLVHVHAAEFRTVDGELIASAERGCIWPE
ncbi:hypothetical protein GCM10023144_42770 [Pigmentiphaga soli]|uniref:N-terminal of MaoC-like dehydratase domain-containing protein n=1 Tax=Pigmentiphaga soli TaxID=1007095 RepID=A0ABP8HN59_9BURK